MQFPNSTILRKTALVFSFFTILFTLITPSGIAHAAQNGVPTILSYQGRLTDASGNLLGTGQNYFFKFSLWDNAAVGYGTKLWPASSPTTYTTSVKSGLFNVNIGDTAHGYPDALDYNFKDTDVYLQIEVSSDGTNFETLAPRQQITASAFAQVARKVIGTDQSSIGTTSPDTNASLTVEATSPSSVPVVIRGAQNQTANLFNINNASGSNIFSIDKVGSVTAFIAQLTGLVTTYATTTHLAIGSLNGILSATNGTVGTTATSSLGINSDDIVQGHTNLFTSPTVITSLVATAISATTTDALAQGSTNKYYNDSLVNSYVNGSSTIAKTYSNNTYSGTATFNNSVVANGGLTTNALTIGALNGLLSATNGVLGNVATSSLGIALSDTTGILAVNRGGTGILSTPSYGNLLVGNSLGGYTLTSTSSLGLLSSAVTAIGPTGQTQTGATQILATSTTGTDFTITASGNTQTFNIPSSSGSSRGLLTSTDWTTFNSKQAALSFTYPIINTANTISLAFGTTTANTWSSTQTFNGGLTTNTLSVGSLSGILFGTNGSVGTISTSTLNINSDNLVTGTTNLFYTNPRVQSYLDTLSKGYFFSTTSAAYWDSTVNRWATTSSDYWLTTKTTDNLAQGSTNKYYNDSFVNSYVHASSTIPKTYTSNTFTGLQSFGNNISFGGAQLAAGALNYGDILSFNGTNWINTATSSLGLVSSVNASGGTTGLTFTGGPITNSGTLTLGGILGVSNGGTGWANINTGFLTFGNGISALGTSSNLFWDNTNSQLGIGTSTPGSLLSIGNTNGINFTTGTSTFASAGGINLTSGCYAVNGTCLVSSTYGDANVNAYINGSSTIAKTYTANTFTGLQSFGNNISFGGAQLAAGALNYGDILSFNGTNWVNTATSSLNLSIPLASTTGTLSVAHGGTGQTSFGQGWLSSDGTTLSASTSPTVNYIVATSTTFASIFPYASTTVVSSNGSAYFATTGGSVGVGTTTPWAKFSISVSNYSPTTPMFVVGSTTGSKSYTPFMVGGDTSTYLGIATSSSYAKLNITTLDTASTTEADIFIKGIASQTGYLINAVNSAGTSQFNLSPAGALAITGNFNAAAGIFSSVVRGTGNTAAVPALENTSQTTTGIFFPAAPNLGTIGFSSAGIEIARFTGGGFLGIGTTSPLAHLTVAATSSTDLSPLFIAATSTGSASTTVFIITNAGNVGIGSTTPSQQMSLNGNIFVSGLGATATSTFQNNLEVLGTLHAKNSYVGDLVFANNFRILEATSTSAEGMIWRNQHGADIFSLNENGDLAVTGDICSSSTNCFNSTITSLTKKISSLETDSTNLLSSSTLSIHDLDSKISLLSSHVDLLEGTTTLNLKSLSEQNAQLAQQLDLLKQAFATSTSSFATTTAFIHSPSFVSEIFNGILTLLNDAVTHIKSIFVSDLHIEDKICVDDVCATKEQFKALLLQASNQNSSATSQQSQSPQPNPAPTSQQSTSPNTTSDTTSSTTSTISATDETSTSTATSSTTLLTNETSSTTTQIISTPTTDTSTPTPSPTPPPPPPPPQDPAPITSEATSTTAP